MIFPGAFSKRLFLNQERTSLLVGRFCVDWDFTVQYSRALFHFEGFPEKHDFPIFNEGFLTNAGGLRVQGYNIATDGTRAAGHSDLELGGVQSPPKVKIFVGITKIISDDVVNSSVYGAFKPNSRSFLLGFK